MVKTNMSTWKRVDIINEEKCIIFHEKFITACSLLSKFIKQPTPPQQYMDLKSKLIWNMDDLSPKRRYLFIGYNLCQLLPFNIPLNVGEWNELGGGGGRIKYSCSDGWRFIDQRLNPNSYALLSPTWSWHVRVRWKVTVRGKLFLLQSTLKMLYQFYRTFLRYVFPYFERP